MESVTEVVKVLFGVGDKVKIVKKDETKEAWDLEGKMDKLIGTMAIVKSIKFSNGSYRLDNNWCYGPECLELVKKGVRKRVINFKPGDKVIVTKENYYSYTGYGSEGVVTDRQLHNPIEIEVDFYCLTGRGGGVRKYPVKKEHLVKLNSKAGQEIKKIRKENLIKAVASVKTYTPLKFKEEIHNRLAGDLKNHLDKNDHYPVCYLLGKDKKEVISDMIEMKREPGRDACEEMIPISGTELSRAILALVKKRLTPCGVARVGQFNLGTDPVYRGHSLEQLGKLNQAFVLSFSSRGVRIDSYNPKDEETTLYEYKIV